VQIWLGAIGPKMLELTGRVGDGWLPSMSYVPPDTLAERNAIIDAAADAAGRAPTDVRRLYNVNPAPGAGRPGLSGNAADWAAQLTELTLAHGMSTFILAGDDPDLINRFAAEVVPAVREQVEAGRSGASVFEAQLPVGEAATGLEVRPTRDDGTRRSAQQPWDETTRPEFARPARERAYSAHDQAVAQHLVDIHDHLRAELTQLLQVIEQVAAGSTGVGQARSLINIMTMRQNNWTLGAFCESYCRVVTTHHSLEDASVFPHLRRRDAGLGPVLDRLESEHHVIAGVLDDVDRALVGLVSSPDGMAGLRAAVDLLSDTLVSHLAYEERMLLEPLARYGFS
jgi:hemerythrin-like domain-containing protein